MNIRENIPLRPFNTFGMDVSAKWFAEVETTEQLCELLAEKKISGSDPMILGGGSNILFTKNIDGLVLRNSFRGISVVKQDENFVYVKVGAGEVWHEFVLDCIRNHRAGVENLSLIPGSVGAAPMQNIGAYGVEMKDVFFELEAFHLGEKVMQIFSHAECKFGYRESAFKYQLKNKFLITSVTFRLSKKPVFNTSYGAIEKELEAMGTKELSIEAISNAVIRIRTGKLPDPKKIGNAGSFFKNPMVSGEKYHSLRKKFPTIVAYTSGDDFKLAAGWLIEQCGWKGKRFGDAGVHKDQALVLVNYGHATGQEIFNLSQRILESVKEKFGVELEREVNIV